MEIIIEGHKVDTKDIWDVQYLEHSRSVSVVVKVTDKPDIIVHRTIPYETRPSEFEEYYAPYERLYKSIKEKWDADKLDIPVFKL